MPTYSIGKLSFSEKSNDLHEKRLKLKFIKPCMHYIYTYFEICFFLEQNLKEENAIFFLAKCDWSPRNDLPAGLNSDSHFIFCVDLLGFSSLRLS